MSQLRAARLGVIIAGPRGVAQSGSAPGWGPGGRRFKSCLPDSGTACNRVHEAANCLQTDCKEVQATASQKWRICGTTNAFGSRSGAAGPEDRAQEVRSLSGETPWMTSAAACSRARQMAGGVTYSGPSTCAWCGRPCHVLPVLRESWVCSACYLVDDEDGWAVPEAHRRLPAAFERGAGGARDEVGGGRVVDAVTGVDCFESERGREHRFADAGRVGVALLMLWIRCRSGCG